MKERQEKTTCDDCNDDQKESIILNKKNLTITSGFLLGLAYLAGLTTLDHRIVVALYVLSILAGGIFVFRSAIKGLFKQRFLNINFLVAIASLGALYIGQYAEAAAVIFFFMLAEFFEDFGVERSRKALEALIKRSPKTAILADGKKVLVEDVMVGNVVIVRPGDLVPLDGKVVKGLSAIDEAAITGESVPSDKRIGDTVFAGTLNLNGYLEIEVTKESKNSTFSKIIELVEKAQASRAPAQEFLDRFAKYYTPIVVGIAFLMAVIPPLFLSQPFDMWLYRALVLLVIACPCALVISTPVAIASAIGGASRNGILIKGGVYLEKLASIKAIAFDKTRTLTYGRHTVTDVLAFGSHSEDEVIADAAGVEVFSSHPLAEAILEYAKSKGITPHAMNSFENVAGKGGHAHCLVCSARHYIGNNKLMSDSGVVDTKFYETVTRLEKEGKTVVLISSETELIGAIAIADEIRKEAKSVITDLEKMGVSSTMLTGANKFSADYVASGVGIKTVYASLSPEEKVFHVEALQKQYGSVAMVGDGINDAPSLATANVGLAIGAGGTDVAIE